MEPVKLAYSPKSSVNLRASMEEGDIADRTTLVPGSPISAKGLLRKEGWLRKRSGFFGRSRTLWFELDETVSVITYFTAPPSAGPLESKLVGTFNLEGAIIEDGISGITRSESFQGDLPNSPLTSPAPTSNKDKKSPREAIASPIPSPLSPKSPKEEAKEKEKRTISIKRKKRSKRLVIVAETIDEAASWSYALKRVRDFAQSSQQLIEEWKGQEGLGDFAKLVAEGSSSDKEETEEDEDEPTALNATGRGFVAELLATRVEDATREGETKTLEEALGTNAPTVLMLMRHFGCMLCRQAATFFAENAAQFQAMNISVIAVGQGTPMMAKSFAKEFNFPGKIYLDTQRVLYKQLNCKRGLKLSMNKRTAAAIKAAYKNGLRQGEKSGDYLQLGGVFAISQKAPNPFIYSHVDKFAGDYVDLPELFRVVGNFLRNFPYDHWISPQSEKRDWKMLLSDSNPEPTSVVNSPGVQVETGKNNVPFAPAKWILEESDQVDMQFYKDYMSETADHIHFTDDGKDEKMSVVVSFDKPGTCQARGIIRTKKGEHRIIIPETMSQDKKDMLTYVKTLYPEFANVKFVQTTDYDVVNQLVVYEEKQKITKYKFGMINLQEWMDLSNENQIYSSVEISKDYHDFMECVGEIVSTQGWQKFSGGLDTKENLTGEKMIYTPFRGIEIAFHVSSFIPFNEKDTQQIGRKKYVGNDVVVVVFKECSQKLDVNVFASQFNHVFCVVEKSKHSTPTQTMYEVNFAVKGGVSPFGPFLPSPSIFRAGADFREFLLTKLINGERSSMHAPQFRSYSRTKKMLLEDIVKAQLSGKPKRDPEFTFSPGKPTDSRRGTLTLQSAMSRSFSQSTPVTLQIGSRDDPELVEMVVRLSSYEEALEIARLTLGKPEIRRLILAETGEQAKVEDFKQGAKLFAV
eukprot:TRINITY_DN224_c0_g2_i1.p1 TRINITY_DN224_c0_g2~~TRINITY_DN224_c0_g2_i1.p1  ORF type:complete len:916 (+),score=295.60 TRINITY_DN224_c0_g2_i1:118-2865(+)